MSLLKKSVVEKNKVGALICVAQCGQARISNSEVTKQQSQLQQGAAIFQVHFSQVERHLEKP